MKVLGHALPPTLESELQGGRATLGPDRLAALTSLLTHVEGAWPKLYGLEGITRESSLWESEDAAFYLGTASTTYSPGDIDPRKSVIIGESEPDGPIALDYRTDPPRVVYLGGVEHEAYWLELAPSYDDLVAKLRPSARD